MNEASINLWGPQNPEPWKSCPVTKCNQTRSCKIGDDCQSPNALSQASFESIHGRIKVDPLPQPELV